MYDKQADLRTLYQAYSSQIEFSKTQSWRVLNYAIWAMAAIVGLFKGFFKPCRINWESKFIPHMITVVFFICLYNMLKCWLSMRQGRTKFLEIRRELSTVFQRTLTAPGEKSFAYNYHSLTYDFWIVFPLILVLLAGSVFTHRLLIHDLKSNMHICSAWQNPDLWTWVVIIFCLLFFMPYFSRQFYRHNRFCSWVHRRILNGFGKWYLGKIENAPFALRRLFSRRKH